MSIGKKKPGRLPPTIVFELTIRQPVREARKPTGAPRGRKRNPQLNPFQPMSPAAQKRMHVAAAAHNACTHYTMMQDAGRPVTWETAITRAVDKAASVWVNENGEPLVTFEAVERQVFPRARDRRLR